MKKGILLSGIILLLFLVMIVGYYSAGLSQQTAPSLPKGEGDFSFASLLEGEKVKDQVLKQNEKEYLVLFYSDRCPHCHTLAKVLQEYVKDPQALPIYAVPMAEENREAFDAFHVDEIPTLLHIQEKEGKKIEKERMVGASYSLQEVVAFAQKP